MRSFDIIVLADCRFPGGTSSALAQELRALAPTGMRVGLAHAPVGKFRSDRPLHPALLEAWRSGLAERIDPDESTIAEVVVVHNPYGFAHRPLPPTAIRTGKRILVVHTTPLNGHGRLNYDPWTVARYLREGLGGAVVWAPISALCRRNMADAGLTAPVLREEWRNIVAADDWGHPRARPLGPVVAVGRHSRPELDKWPPTRTELFRVYPPDDEHVRVRLLGVDERLEALAGGWPRGWTAFRFDEIAPRDFVRTIDFFVYFHHPRWVETFGRCTAEAIASGAVAILPPYMRTNFDDAAVYCGPDEAVATAKRFHADADLYAELSRRGQEIIAREYGPERFRSLVRRVLNAPTDMAEFVEQRGPGLRTLRTFVALRLPPSTGTQLRHATKRRRGIRNHVRRGAKILWTGAQRAGRRLASSASQAAADRRTGSADTASQSKPAKSESTSMLLSIKKAIKRPVKKVVKSLRRTRRPRSTTTAKMIANGGPVPSTCVERGAQARQQRRTFMGSDSYWEQRYRHGGNSGAGSYGRFAEFKADVLNLFVRDHDIETVIEFGCGDGSQLALANYGSYIGLDVSETIIKSCIARFHDDSTKSFFVYKSGSFKDNHGIFLCDLALSLDVVYHLMEDHVFKQYMTDLFSCGRRFVIIYSSNVDRPDPAIHIRHRMFTRWVEKNEPDWILTERINNKYPYSDDHPSGSWSDFFVYENQQVRDRAVDGIAPRASSGTSPDGGATV